MKIRPTENCEFCGEYDSLSHFFANCLISKRVWKEASSIIHKKTGLRFGLDEKRVLFGILKDDTILPCRNQALNIINKIILIGKHTISKFKFERSGSPIVLFEREIWIRDLND